MLWQYTKRDAVKNFFPLPNEIFSLGLSFGALAVCSYLLYCEDRKSEFFDNTARSRWIFLRTAGMVCC